MNDYKAVLQQYLINTHAPAEVLHAMREADEYIQRMESDLNAGRQFLKERVAPLRELAMDISLKYEPCGYYCDESVGHVDHKLFNHAKYLFGSGIEDYLPVSLDPFPENRADSPRKGRF